MVKLGITKVIKKHLIMSFQTRSTGAAKVNITVQVNF